MNQGVQLSTKAIELRREGKSYSDIAKVLKVSRSSVCGWVKNVRLTEQEKALLLKTQHAKMSRGRMQATITLRTRKVFQEKTIYDTAEKEFEKFSKDPLFLIGLGMSGIGKGEKGVNSFQFTTGDSSLAKIIIKWLEKYFNISKKSLKLRLFVAFTHKNEPFVDYWSKTLGISEGNFWKTVILKHKKDPKDTGYRGSLEITVSNSDAVRKLKAWQNVTIRYYS